MRIITALLALFAITSMVSASTGTGSTGTGSTATGSTSTGVVVVAPNVGGGGLTVAYNKTTKQNEFVPQCFPWVWLVEYYKGNIFDMYINQDICRAKRFVDFGM